MEFFQKENSLCNCIVILAQIILFQFCKFIVSNWEGHKSTSLPLLLSYEGRQKVTAINKNKEKNRLIP